MQERNAVLSGPMKRAAFLISEAVFDIHHKSSIKFPRLFFLCGANKKEGEISRRRALLKDFIEESIDNSKAIIAEDFFNNYIKNHRKKGDKENSLDFEYILTEISEKVIIVLESNSAFCELGAFSHRSLREKLIIVNDKNFQEQKSFINTGPLLAIKEQYGSNRILWYKMKQGGPDIEDSISSIFLKLKTSINESSPKKTKTLNIDFTHSSINIDKVMFIHDVIYLYKEISYSQLIDIIKIVFSDSKEKSFDNVKEIMAVLSSLHFINYTANKITSTQEKTFLTYGRNHQKVRNILTLGYLKGKMAS